MASWRDLPGPARRIGATISAAIDAARDGDREAFVTASAEVAALPADQTGIVLGAIVRSLLEDQHPDGLDGDDMHAVLARCFRGAVAWLPFESVDVQVLVAVLSSALGIHEPGVTYEEITGPIDTRGTGDDWAGDPDVPSIGASAGRRHDRHAEGADHGAVRVACPAADRGPADGRRAPAGQVPRRGVHRDRARRDDGDAVTDERVDAAVIPTQRHESGAPPADGEAGESRSLERLIFFSDAVIAIALTADDASTPRHAHATRRAARISDATADSILPRQH